METNFIFLQQNTTGAVLEIVVLLIIAGLIGYLTSYFYYKSVYTKKIDVLEGEKTGLQNDIENLVNQKRDLEQTIKEQAAEIVSLKKPAK